MVVRFLTLACAFVMLATGCNDHQLIGLPATPGPVTSPGAGPSPPPPVSGQVAVVTGLYDRVEDVLSRVGATNVDLYNAYALLDDFNRMKQYDVIFINCGAEESGLVNSTAVQNNLRTFIEEGGSLYASDWAYDYVEQTFPDAIDFYGTDLVVDSAQLGVPEYVTAGVDDSILQASMGTASVVLNYDLGGWVVPTGVGPGSRVLVSGNVKVYNAVTFDEVPVGGAPLLITFEYGAGRVLYTSFHNEPQTTSDMDALLEFMLYEL